MLCVGGQDKDMRKGRTMGKKNLIRCLIYKEFVLSQVSPHRYNMLTQIPAKQMESRIDLQSLQKKCIGTGYNFFTQSF